MSLADNARCDARSNSFGEVDLDALAREDEKVEDGNLVEEERGGVRRGWGCFC